MRQVKVKRHQLLEKLKANRAGHRSIFEKAQIGYREQAVAELDAMLAEAKAGKRIRRAVSLDEPIDQTREYDRVIAMLEMSVDDEVELDALSARTGEDREMTAILLNAYALGFGSFASMDAFFCRLFRQRPSPTPEQWRKFLMHVSKQAPSIRRWTELGSYGK